MSYGRGYSAGAGYGGGFTGYDGGYSAGGGGYSSWAQTPPGTNSTESKYAAWAAQASAYASGGTTAMGGGYCQGQRGRTGSGASGGSGEGKGLTSTLQAMAYFGGGSSGGGFESGGGGRLKAGLDMSKYAGYQTNVRKMDERGGGGRARFGDRHRRGDGEKRLRREPLKQREGREPELDLYIDKRFNYWNLPTKARVLLISNVPQAICQPDLLYNLFSFYGDVERVKIIRMKNNCAQVAFTTATFACIARDNLDQVSIRGETLVVTVSRFDRVRMPQEIGLPGDAYTQDFSGPDYQKFKRYSTEELKRNNMPKIIAPTSTIHVGGIQAGKSPNDIKRLFENFGLTVLDCVGVSLEKKNGEEAVPPPGNSSLGRMFCYVQFATVDDSLIGFSQIGNAAGMRISFVKDNLDILKKNWIEKKVPLIMGEQVAE